MLKVTVINKIEFPNIELQPYLEEIAKDIIIPDIVMGIDTSMAIDGGALPTNEPKTIKRKGSSRPLIETGEMRSSFYYKLMGKSKVLITVGSDRKKIGGYLQDGIWTKNSGLKQYLFFGISKDAFDSTIRYVEKKIKELTSGRRG